MKVVRALSGGALSTLLFCVAPIVSTTAGDNRIVLKHLVHRGR